MNHLRKLALLAIAAAATIALAAPALAQADAHWKIGGKQIGSELQSVEMHGYLRFETPAGAVKITCPVVEDPYEEGGGFAIANGNEEWGDGMAHGVQVGTWPSPGEHDCQLSAGGVTCELTENVMAGQSIDIVGERGVNISEFGFLTVIEGCPVIEGEVLLYGTLEGTFNNSNGCIEYNHAGALKTGETKWSTDGQFCLTSPGGKVELG